MPATHLTRVRIYNVNTTQVALFNKYHYYAGIKSKSPFKLTG